MKTCTKCGEVSDNFTKNRRVCRVCRRGQRDPEAQQAYYEANKERRKARTKAWVDANRHAWNALCAKARAKRKHRALGLSEDQEWMIREIYELARLRTEVTGTAHEVDHIIPLCGKYVSGLHVPHNLQVLTKADNRRKSNNV